MENIVLIIPSNPFLDEEKRNCPLGILYVAAVLEQAGYAVQVVDLRGLSKEFWDIPQSEVYGITSSSAEFPYAVEVSNYLRERGPCKVIIGGAHTVALDDCLKNGFSVVVGEGERAILDILKNGSQVAERPFIENLDSIPFPARHLLPRESVVSMSLCHSGVPATTIIASRGCPFNCLYCSSPGLWQRRVRRHSPEYTIREVETLVRDYGVKELRFQDDEVNLDREWLKSISSLSDLVKWRGNARAELGNWDYLKAAGCYEVAIGVETVNPEAHRMNKGVSLDKTRQGIHGAYEAGLGVRLLFIIGLPYDSGDIFGRMTRFLESMPPLVGVHLNIFSPFPGSAIGDGSEKFGIESRQRPVSVSPQHGKPQFTFRSKWATKEELTDCYYRLRSYIQEKGWILP